MTANTDIQRLVYPPKAWAFVKTADGKTLDLTEYIIGGEIQRVLNSPSTATLTLRNPYHTFTTYGNKHAILHPMDPITIYLQRFDGHHVQVFTGYLDTTPYLQLIPGIIKIQATCTLKRLLYNYFQLAQIYTLEFFKHFGWSITAGGAIGPTNQGPLIDNEFVQRSKKKWVAEETEGKLTEASRKAKEKSLEGEEKQAAERAQKAKTAEGSSTQTPAPFTNFGQTKPQVIGDDGSFKKLLWAVLYYMADWKDENIYIEEIPEGVPALIASLWADFNETERQEQLDTLKSYWAGIIGVGSQGSGGGSGNPKSIAGSKTGNQTGLTEVVATMASIAEKYHLPPAFVITTSLCECGFKQSEVTGTNSSGATGWFQFTSSEPYPGIKVNYPSDAHDTGLATAAFCQAAVTMGHQLAGSKSFPAEGEWQHWAEETQKPGAGAYNPSWGRCLSEAKNDLQSYKPRANSQSEGSSTTQRSKTNSEPETNKPSTSSKTRLNAMVERADEIDKKQYPYAWAGGHPSVGKPSIGTPGGPAGSSGVLGFDCSGSVATVLSAGGFLAPGSSVGASGEFGSLNIPGWSAGEDTSKEGVNIFFNSEHAWMTIKGRYFSTGWNDNKQGGAGWGSTDPSTMPNRGEYPGVMHLSHATLNQTYSGPTPPTLTGGSGNPAEELTQEAGEAAGVMGQATAASFLSQIRAPSEEEFVLAAAVGGQRALMNTTPVLNLVEQVCQSSLRSFMSLPNGDFYAFYPDYFGEFGHHQPYWKIHNIEIQSGTIELTDNYLVTHYFAIGDTAWPGSAQGGPQVKLVNELFAGAMTIVEAFHPGVLLHGDKKPTKGNEPKKGGRAVGNTQDAVAFLQRYGARVAKHEFNMIYSTLFDQLVAYQQFLLAWSRQFQSEFHFTFMPELFPGGKVAFPEHGVQMFIEEVTHVWDLEGGFETSALLTAPSVYRTKTNAAAINELPENMVDALVEPQRKQIGKVSKSSETPVINPVREKEKKKELEKGKAFGPSPGTSDNSPFNNNPFVE